MDTWMEKDYPWLIEEKNKIKEFVVDLEKPYLGFCLGCQLLGEVLGGNVVKSTPPEIANQPCKYAPLTIRKLPSSPFFTKDRISLITG